MGMGGIKMNKRGDSFVSEDTKQTIMVKINGIIEKLDNLRILGGTVPQTAFPNI